MLLKQDNGHETGIFGQKNHKPKFLVISFVFLFSKNVLFWQQNKTQQSLKTNFYSVLASQMTGKCKRIIWGDNVRNKYRIKHKMIAECPKNRLEQQKNKNCQTWPRQ